MTRLDLTLKMTGADGSESIEHRTVQIQDHPDAGAHSSEEVRKLVTAAGLRTKTGRKLTKQAFSFTIKNPVYCALLVHNGQTYKASFPALAPGLALPYTLAKYSSITPQQAAGR